MISWDLVWQAFKYTGTSTCYRWCYQYCYLQFTVHTPYKFARIDTFTTKFNSIFIALAVFNDARNNDMSSIVNNNIIHKCYPNSTSNRYCSKRTLIEHTQRRYMYCSGTPKYTDKNWVYFHGYHLDMKWHTKTPWKPQNELALVDMLTTRIYGTSIFLGFGTVAEATFGTDFWHRKHCLLVVKDCITCLWLPLLDCPSRVDVNMDIHLSVKYVNLINC